MNYDSFTAQDRRLALLRVIQENGGQANERTLYSAITAMGFPATTRDDVRQDLELLGQRHCLTKVMFDSLFLVVTLTEIGRDVADGKRAVQGVKKGDPSSRR